MKIKIIAILSCAVIIFGAGMCVAYYNTKSFGFDENAKVVHYDDEKISFMDFDIYYKDVTGFIDRVSEIIPEKSRTVSIRTHHNVVVI